MKKLIPAILVMLCIFAAAVPVGAADYTVTSYADQIVLDGSITTQEWGDPISTYTPQQCLDNRAIGWGYRNYSSIPANQKVNIYITNDGDSVYIGCQLVGADKDMTNDHIDRISSHPHFAFTIGAYYEDTMVQRTIFQSQEYERYTAYGIGFVNGEAALVAKAQGITTTNHLPVEYAAAYDAAARTYTYEVRVPLFNTNIDVNKNPVVVMSFDVGDAGAGSTAGNRYLIARAADKALDNSMGPYIFAHGKTHPPTFELHNTAALSGWDFTPDDKAQEVNNLAIYELVDTGVRTQSRVWTPASIACAAAAGAAVILAGIIVGINRRQRVG